MRRIRVKHPSRLIALHSSVFRTTLELQVTNLEHNNESSVPLFISLDVRQVKWCVQRPTTPRRHKK
jgi:hypothetical protein